MEQMLLLVMIVGRWLLPRGEHLSRDQKAQLLLVNIAIAADILELFEMMKEEQVKKDKELITKVLSLWSVSLIQFAIVATATVKKSWRGCFCFENEIWSLLTLLFLDDAPFLAFRLVCIIKYQITSYNSYFFAAKNMLVLALDVNRILALYKEMRKERAKNESSTELKDVDRRISITHIRR
ncbi:transmembrane protein 26-like [Watersipora subatra]|uniref:transmembrane protein 26-like n=1 Tax=Watersipora subatra TaxID=2589382 RepID=UPI00355B2218